MQENNFAKMVDVGKFLAKNIEFLFKKYINQNNSKFNSIRYNYVFNYLKKLIQTYHKKKEKPSLLKPFDSKNNSPSRKTLSLHESLLTEINLEQLIFLLEQKSYNSSEYKNLISAHLKSILTQK
jgi:hypothetical protein